MYTSTLFTLIVLPICMAVIDETGCPESFKKKCKCGNAKSHFSYDSRFIVNCTNSEFTNVDMLQDLPEETEELIFTGNTVPTLPANVFDTDINYEDLNVIDLSNNHIRFIQGKSFHNVWTVETLLLNHNDIEITGKKERPRIFSGFENLLNLHLTNAFTEEINSTYYLLVLENVFFESDLRYLKKLHLEQNEIYSIGTNKSLFCQLPNLEQLCLGNNRLSDMDFTIDCMKKLYFIDLQRNSINRLSKGARDRLDQVPKRQSSLSSKFTLGMRSNPFVCDCFSSAFLEWTKTTKVDLRNRNEYVCMDGYPNSNIGKKIDDVTEMECAVPSQGGYSASTIGVLSFLLVFLSSMLLVIAYFQWNKIKGVLMPYWQFITRKIGYTGLANEEIPQEIKV